MEGLPTRNCPNRKDVGLGWPVPRWEKMGFCREAAATMSCLEMRGEDDVGAEPAPFACLLHKAQNKFAH